MHLLVLCWLVILELNLMLTVSLLSLPVAAAVVGVLGVAFDDLLVEKQDEAALVLEMAAVVGEVGVVLGV